MMFLERLRSLPLGTKLLPGLALAGVALVALLGNSCQPGDAKVRYTDEQIESFARSIIEIEPLRLETSDRIQELIGPLPPIICADRESLQTLAPEARELATTFCDRSLEIAKENGLTIKEFNGITREVQEDPDTKVRVEESVRDLFEGQNSQSQNVLNAE